jgi:hypothetical protein
MRYLDELGIEVKTFEHPPLFTVEESRSLRGKIPGAHTKNLFLKDKKDRLFLLTVEEEARLDLKAIHQLIGGIRSRILRQRGKADGVPWCDAGLRDAVRRNQ